jgi:hypothetical protein
MDFIFIEKHEIQGQVVNNSLHLSPRAELSFSGRQAAERCLAKTQLILADSEGSAEHGAGNHISGDNLHKLAERKR